MDIILAPETLFQLGPLSLTNTLFTTIIILISIVIFILVFRWRYNFNNPGNFQLLIEYAISALYGLVEDITGKAQARKIFPFVFTFFIYILFANWLGLLLLVPSFSIGEPHHVDSTLECLKSGHCYLTSHGLEELEHTKHIFRPPTSDLSAAISFALISVVVTNALGFSYLGWGYLKKYINFSNPINFFVGLLEILSEFGKVISFSFRLFGNIFAGEVLILVITSISFGFATFPFLGLEIFVGLIQALVFFMLTTVFISLAISHEEH